MSFICQEKFGIGLHFCVESKTVLSGYYGRSLDTEKSRVGVQNVVTDMNS